MPEDNGYKPPLEAGKQILNTKDIDYFALSAFDLARMIERGETDEPQKVFEALLVIAPIDLESTRPFISRANPSFEETAQKEIAMYTSARDGGNHEKAALCLELARRSFSHVYLDPESATGIDQTSLQPAINWLDLSYTYEPPANSTSGSAPTIPTQ